MADTEGTGSYIQRQENFGSDYTNDLFYDNKITWENTRKYFNKKDIGLDNQEQSAKNIKVFGLPWYLYPELNGVNKYLYEKFKGQHYIRGEKKYKNFDGTILTANNKGDLDKVGGLIRERVLDSTVTVRVTSRDDDPYGNIFRKMNNLVGGMNALMAFITTKQWNNREQIHEDIENKQISLYTDLITEETHNNVQYQLNNTVDQNTLKNFSDILYEMITAMPFGIGTAVSGFWNYGREYGYKGLMGEGTNDFLGGVFSFHNFTKMLTRETINLWRAGKQLMTTKFEFHFRASSHETLEEFFTPVLFLTQLQQPNSVQIDGGDSGFKIVEKVPPIPVDIIIGDPSNPIIKLGKSIITNLKVEVYDYKYIDGQFGNIDSILSNDKGEGSQHSEISKLIGGQKNKRVPTQQRVMFDIEPIIPIVQFSEQISKETTNIDYGGETQITQTS